MKSNWMFFWISGLFFCLPSLNAQENQIEYEFDSTEAFYCNILFKNKKSGSLVKRFNIIQNNPYNYLPYTKYGLTDEGNVKYRLENLTDSEIHYFIPQEIPDAIDTDKLCSPNFASSYHYVYTKGENYTCVAYHLGSAADNYTISQRSTIYVLNSQGEIVHCLEHMNEVIQYPSVTEDGKFLIYSFTTQNNCTDYEFDSGHLIYNLFRGETVLKNIEKGFSQAHLYEGSIVVARNMEAADKSVDHRIYDLNVGLEYRGVLSAPQMKNIKTYSKVGVNLNRTVKNGKGNMVSSILYDEQFTKTKIWK